MFIAVKLKNLIGDDFLLNKLWPIFILISIFYSIFTGNIENVNNCIFNSATSAVDLSINLLGTICLWSGIMEIAANTNIIKILTKFLEPLLKILFPELKNDSEIKKQISMNMIANILGLGNAATPLGLKAMKSMQLENKNKTKLSNSMTMFIILNTASIQLIPTTIIAIRNSLGSENPTKIIFPVWIVTVISAFTGILLTKIFIKIEGEKD